MKAPEQGGSLADAQSEIARLNRIIRALMDRAERSTSLQNSDFSLFQTAILLEEQVRRRTEDLESALMENRRINRALRESEEKFRKLVTQSLVGIAIIEDGRFSYVNPRFADIFGYGQDEMLALGPLDITQSEQHETVTEMLRRRLSGECEDVSYVSLGLRKNGSSIDIEVHGSTMVIDGKRSLISLVLDITERVKAEREVRALQKTLQEQATHDRLTGLYNRLFLEESFERELALARRREHPISIVMADLDHFKRVNDQYGHQAGDAVLKQFASVMESNSRGSDICCRYGGEEFLLILPDMELDQARNKAEQLRANLAENAIVFGGNLIPVTASFGIACFPEDGTSAEKLISAADANLYSAKAGGRNQVRTSADRPSDASAVQ